MVKRILLILFILMLLIPVAPVLAQEIKKGAPALKSKDTHSSMRSDKPSFGKGFHHKGRMQQHKKRKGSHSKKKKHHKGHIGKLKDIFRMKKMPSPIRTLIVLLIRIMLLVVVIKDVKQRANASNLWIFIVLLGGIPAAIAYGVFCISCKKA